jgi:hypothetical protein
MKAISFSWRWRLLFRVVALEEQVQEHPGEIGVIIHLLIKRQYSIP